MSTRNRFFSVLCAVLFAVPLFLSQSSIALAEALSPGFTVDAVIPDNQIEDQAYFSLLVEPEQSQRLLVQVNNHLNEAIHVRLDITGAQTSSNGLISYEPSDVPTIQTTPGLPEMLSFDVNALQVGPNDAVIEMEDNHLILAPMASVQLPFMLTTPKEALSGQVLGGIVLTKEDDPDASEDNGFQIKSEFGYALAVQLQSERVQNDIVPSFSFDGVTIIQLAGFPALSLSITNEKPLVVTGALLSIAIFSESDDTQPLLQRKDQRISMAPQSTMAYDLSLAGDDELLPGTYRMQIAFMFQGERHDFEGTFTIVQPTR